MFVEEIGTETEKETEKGIVIRNTESIKNQNAIIQIVHHMAVRTQQLPIIIMPIIIHHSKVVRRHLIINIHRHYRKFSNKTKNNLNMFSIMV